MPNSNTLSAFVPLRLNFSKDRFTKHYYAGTQRVASKIGVGEFNNLYIQGSTNITAGQKDYAARIELIEAGRSEYYAELGIPPGPPTSKGIFGEPEYTGSSLTNGTLGNYDIPDNWPQPAIKNGPGDVPGPPVQYGDAVNPDVVEPGYGYSTAVSITEDDIYFYHSDHLGSTSYITDLQGNPTQFVCYMPFGEAYVDEHTTRTEMPFKFNGKEQDAETGLYYYGARYYDPLICVWYGVDPLAEKGRRWSTYVYCFNNPIRFIDPDGMWGDDILKRLVDYASSKLKGYVNEVATRTIESLARSAGNMVKDEMNRIDVSLYAEGNVKVSSGGQGALKVKNLGADIDMGSVDLGSIGFEIDSSKDADNVVDANLNFIGENNEVTFNKSVSLGYGGDIELSSSSTENLKSNEFVRESINGSIGGGPEGWGGQSQISVITDYENKSKTLRNRTGVGMSWSFGTGLKISGTGSAGVQIQYESKLNKSKLR